VALVRLGSLKRVARMSGTSCPRCDAPAAAGARACAGCGYRFVEDGGAARRPSPWPLVGAGAVAALVVVALVAIADGGENDEPPATARPAAARLQIISERPLSTPRIETAIEELYIPLRDDDTGTVDCTARVAKPAHSVRRCEIRYANGTDRRVVVLTNARGNEVLSKP
jgi:hypothetical protein